MLCGLEGSNLLTVSKLGDNRFQLEGAVDGAQDFHELLPALSAGAAIDCEGVTRINSSGIKAWMKFFCAPNIITLTLRFEAVSIPLVEQLNMFRNFLGGGKVISMAVPFRCEACDLNFSNIFQSQDALRFKDKDAKEACTQCGKPARFDDLADEYFQFMGRKA
jgi:hypothetical protein